MTRAEFKQIFSAYIGSPMPSLLRPTRRSRPMRSCSRTRSGLSSKTRPSCCRCCSGASGCTSPPTGAQPHAPVQLAAAVLRLLPRTEVRGQHLVIDFFFQSLAEDLKDRAVGVVLSGPDQMGRKGLAAMKAEGGITFVKIQSPPSLTTCLTVQLILESWISYSVLGKSQKK